MKFQMGFTQASVISVNLVLETEGFLFSFEESSYSLGWPYVYYKAEDDLEHLIVPHPASPSQVLEFRA